MLGELGKGPPLQEYTPRGGGGGSSLLDRAVAALDESDADAHAALPRAAGGGTVDSQHRSGIVVQQPGVDEEADGAVGAGAMPATSVPGHEGEGVILRSGRGSERNLNRRAPTMVGRSPGEKMDFGTPKRSF